MDDPHTDQLELDALTREKMATDLLERRDRRSPELKVLQIIAEELKGLRTAIENLEETLRPSR